MFLTPSIPKFPNLRSNLLAFCSHLELAQSFYKTGKHPTVSKELTRPLPRLHDNLIFSEHLSSVFLGTDEDSMCQHITKQPPDNW